MLTEEEIKYRPEVGETWTEYAAMHLGIPHAEYVRLFNRGNSDELLATRLSIDEKDFVDRLNHLPSHFHSWKDGVKSSIRVPPNSATLDITHYVPELKASRPSGRVPKRESLPGQMVFADAKPTGEPT